MQDYFKKAIDEAYIGIKNKEGGPFGAVIVSKDGKIIGCGHNEVIKFNDPTLHAEMVAIKNASKNINNYDLSGCKIYTTSEPCPMCLSAIIWSNIKEIYYLTNRYEVSKIGFRDELIYDYFENKKQDIIKISKIENIDGKKLLNDYKNVIY